MSRAVEPVDVAIVLSLGCMVVWFGAWYTERPRQASLRTMLLCGVSAMFLVVALTAKYGDPWLAAVFAATNRGLVLFGGTIVLSRALRSGYLRWHRDRRG